MAKPKKAKFTSAALVLSTEEAMVGTLNRYVELSLEITKLNAEHEEKISKLNTGFDESVQKKREELAMLESSVQLFCVNHRGYVFPDDKKKSKEYANATIGFRDNPPSVDKRLSKDTWEAIALRLDSTEWGENYVDWKPAVKKSEILRDRVNFTPDQLQEAGIRFAQEENFYIDPKSDEADRSAKPVSELKEVA